VRTAVFVALIGGVLLGSGCGSQHIVVPAEGSREQLDAKYTLCLANPMVEGPFTQFLESCTPEDKVIYINRSLTDFNPIMTARLQKVYEKFANDPNPDVQAAAKEALSKVPTPAELEQIYKNGLENMKQAEK
jgi:hypothetical protein